MFDVKGLKFQELMKPTIDILKSMGGAADKRDIFVKIVEKLNVDEKALSAVYPKSGKPIFEDKFTWCLSYLKIAMVIKSEKRSKYALIDMSTNSYEIDPEGIKKLVVNLHRKQRSQKNQKEATSDKDQAKIPDEEYLWTNQLLEILKKMNPYSFEKLSQRILTESGFINVVVTKKAKDGGIDGYGYYQVGGLVSFPVAFQCKRYSGIVGSPEIEQFRGSMDGKADRGLFVTTGTFSSEAVNVANRDGAKHIDLIDGDQLCEKLKELGLGVSVEMVEKVTVNETFFTKFDD